MVNPLKELKEKKKLTWRDVTQKANLSLSHAQNLCEYTPDDCLELTLGTWFKLYDAFGINLLDYAASGGKRNTLRDTKELTE